MLTLALIPIALQTLAMACDELIFHRRRGLPRWERLGHPLDTLSAAACYAWLVLMPPTGPHALGVYLSLCAFSCLLITKDEFVHARVCEPIETWLHAVLFVLHPIVFFAVGLVWYDGTAPWLPKLALFSALGLFLHQLLYWSPLWQRTPSKPRS